MAFSPDGRWIVSGNSDKTLKVWDAATGQRTLSLRGHTRSVDSVAFSADGRRIVSVTEVIDAKAVELWRWSYCKGIHIRKDVQSGIYKRLEKFAIEIPN